MAKLALALMVFATSAAAAGTHRNGEFNIEDLSVYGPPTSAMTTEQWDALAASDDVPQCPDDPRKWVHMWLACYDYTHKQDPKLWEPRK